MSMLVNRRHIPGLRDRWDGVYPDEQSDCEDAPLSYQEEVYRHNEIVCKAECRLYEKDQAALGAAHAASDEVLGLLIAKVEAAPIQVERTYKTTPPGCIGLPGHLPHIALAARLLPVPTSAAALESRVAG